MQERFWEKVDRSGDCWEWTAAKTTWGYGYFYFEGRPRQAHRVGYMLTVGPIPDGLELDHLCRNRACVRPDHLEPVTGRVNLLRGEGASAVNAVKTHCVNGHRFTDENTYAWRGTRNCKTCREAATAKRDRTRPARRTLTSDCTVCGSPFTYERGPGGSLRKLCSDECRAEDGRRRAREYQRRKRAARRS